MFVSGSYFCFDNPGALQDNFKDDLGMSTSKFVLLYSIYSWPNVILCFIGGFLLDSVFGIRLGTVIYMALTLIGQLIFASGAIIDAFWLMMLGRFVFGYVSIELCRIFEHTVVRFLHKMKDCFTTSFFFPTESVRNRWRLPRTVTQSFGSRAKN